MAARATRSFASELSVWARTLKGDVAEIASVLASDIADLRAALEQGNPFEQTLRDTYASGQELLVVTRTMTAANALHDLLGITPNRTPFIVQPIHKLHRQGTWRHALMVGEPSPWDWHRLVSGLTPRIEVLTLGEQSARGCVSSLATLAASRDHWGGVGVREHTWRALVGTAPPDTPRTPPRRSQPVLVEDAAEYVAQPDPFDALESLFVLDPLDLRGEGPSASIARESGVSAWTAAVPAVAITTDRGRILLEVGQPIDVREGSRITEQRPETLEPGAILLVGRRQGRVGLLEALEERLADRPDLLAARFLVDHYRRVVRTRFLESGFTIAALHEALVGLGCDKTTAAVRSWVTEGTMAPQQFIDLERLNDALGLGMSPMALQELFAGVQRRRGFRRAAGRALAAAARGSTVITDESQVDDETVLSIADLREAVVEVVVQHVASCDQPVPLTLLGRLEES
jgi:hypothetical protein